MGTSRYMSPEQARGQKVDARTDIWSLGALLYEMVAGRPPFEGDSSAEVIARVLEREPLPLARYAPEVPAELQRIVSKALMKDREERYQGVKDLLLDLKALKQELEFDARLGRSVSLGAPGNISSSASTDSGRTTGAPVSGPVSHASAANTLPAATSAEHDAGRIRRYKLAAFVGLLALVLSAALGLWLYFRASNSGTTIDSIAVLPFVNQTQDPETEYLSDGLTESIINSLTQLPDLRVIARSFVFRYKGKETDPIAIGNALGVRAVLMGRVTQRGDDLTVSVELVDVNDNKQLWGEHYKRKVSDLLAVQRDIAQEISSNLRTKISGEVHNRVTKRYTENAEAYQLYLKGRYFWNKRTGEGLKESIKYFNQAIERDPNYALAYAGLADAYVLFSGYAVSTPQDSYPKAKAAARRALELDDTLAEAHAALGLEMFAYEWNAAEASREFRRAIELNPNYATAHHWYGNQILLYTGRFDEAIAEMKRAQELDPLSLIVNADLGDTYFYARQYDKAIEQLRKTIEMDQSFYYAHYELGMAYEMKGSFQEAIAEYQRARQLNNDPRVLALLGHAYAASGRRDEALKILGQLKETASQQYVPAYNFVIVYAGLGERDQAFQWLEQSYQDHASRMTILQVDPFLDPLRSDPRFANLVSRVNLQR
jgi:eukaryotic-like serine/threonine-protein kinase